MKGTKTLLSYLIFIIGLQWKTIYVAATAECGPNYFKCKKNSRCIIGSFVCDGENDCEEDDDGDYSDEENCKKKPEAVPMACLADEFQCKTSKKCILKSYTCDSFDDCGDNSDEATIDGPNCANRETCPGDMYKCKASGKCVYKSYLCDGEVDCGKDSNGKLDDSDERENCAQLKCSDKEFKCNDYRCVDKTWLCDGSDDCGDNSDETNCPASGNSTVTAQTTPTPVTAKKTTAPGELVSSNCKVFSFYCPKDDRCIHEKWVCDGMEDCSDGSDERQDLCAKCKNDEFKCNNGTCIPNSWTCDGKAQCFSGEDENLEKCDASVPCSGETYKCKGFDNKCINQTHVCDKVKNCPSGDDEATCGINECDEKNGGCSHHCIDEKIGHSCACPFGFKLGKDNRTCVDVNECLQAGSCSQTCRNTEGSYHCECDDGYMLLSDKKTCRAKAPLPYLIFSSKIDIREATTNFKDYKAVVNQVPEANSVDVDINKQMIYFSDVTKRRISRVPRGKSSAAEILIENIAVKSLAVNWISQNLFWTDGKSIFVSNLDGRHKKTFMTAERGEEFYSLAIVPEEGLLFWSDIGVNPKIESITFYGTKRSVLVDSTKSVKPSLLTIDRNKLNLFWVDASTNQIASTTLNGSNYRVVTKLDSQVDGMTVFEDFLYLTSNKRGEVNKINKFTGLRIGRYSVDSPHAITVFHPLLQKKVYHPCQNVNGGCSHLCFISDVNLNDFKCACPDTMKLYTDGKTCISKVASTNPCIGGYRCRVTNKCIPKHLLCNGIQNCAFRDDEMNCAPIATNKPSIATYKHTTYKPSVKAPVQTSNEVTHTDDEDKVNILLPIGICAAVLVLFVLVIVMVIQYRKKKQKMEMSMVFEKESSLLDGKDGKVDVEIKYIPNTKPHHKTSRANKNFENKNFVEVPTAPNVPLSGEDVDDINDTEMMVDESSDSSSDNNSENNVLIS